MSSSLRSALNDLAQSFTEGVLNAIRSANLQDLLSEGGGTRQTQAQKMGNGRTAPRRTPIGRLARRTPEQIGKVVDQIVALLKKNKDGLRSEQIREHLRLDRRELPRVIAEGLKGKKIQKRGAKRATVYTAR